jgi:hypothetical protein
LEEEEEEEEEEKGFSNFFAIHRKRYITRNTLNSYFNNL